MSRPVSRMAAAWTLLLATSSGCTLVALTACSRAQLPPASTGTPSVLLFDGTGTSVNDLAAIESVLQDRQIAYTRANSRQLDAMTKDQLLAFRLLIVPGGDFEELGKGLQSKTTATVRGAVHEGLNYLGVCAGAFFAGNSPYNGLNLTGGVRFNFYAPERQNIHKSAVTISVAGTSTSDHYWEDGPEFTGWGAVVAKYPDGTPAIVEGNAGRGWMILSGIHPEAPESWREGLVFETPVRINIAYTGTLISAALNRTRLDHY